MELQQEQKAADPLPISELYLKHLQDLRFDYIDVEATGNDTSSEGGRVYTHYFTSQALNDQETDQAKMVRLAEELSNLTSALPCEHTNAIFVRVEKKRMDMVKAIICGAAGTPYAHGCFEYDIFCGSNYPSGPPQMKITTTGNGTVRFNPNLYACGNVCLSLLGTWQGEAATENWDPDYSTLLQLLVSTQCLVMSEDVYFNEPGYEGYIGTESGITNNEGYSNIVRLNNIRFAMIEQIRNPPKGFEEIVKRHFYIKKDEILSEVKSWVTLADTKEATYDSLILSHNQSFVLQFSETPTSYKDMLIAIIQELEDELNKIEGPSTWMSASVQGGDDQINQDTSSADQKKKTQQDINEGKMTLEHIDVSYDTSAEMSQLNSEQNLNGIDIQSDAVKDRWSRYIGAMGTDAVAKQAVASIFLSGAGALGAEIAKNIVLSGCKAFTLHDTKPITYRDLSGQFFLNLEDDLLNEERKNMTRAEACLPRLQQLNYYVQCKLAASLPIPMNEQVLDSEAWNLSQYDLVILTEASHEEIIFVNEYCRKHNKKFIAADSYGVFTRVFNDFGSQFEVLDKNGEELQDVMINHISNEEQGLVQLIPNAKLRLEDGDEVLITQVEGMATQQTNEEQSMGDDSINSTLHRVTVVSPYSFRIGDTRLYSAYLGNGIAKQQKTKQTMNFKPFKEVMTHRSCELPFDQNLVIADFEKIAHNRLSHFAFEALDTFKKQNHRLPGVWDINDAQLFITYAKAIISSYDLKSSNDHSNIDATSELSFLYLFSFTCQGIFNPMCAFMGGVVAQEAIKAITHKFTPIQQVFYYNAFEVLPQFDPPASSIPHKQDGVVAEIEDDAFTKKFQIYKEINHRSDGLRIILGQDVIEQLAHTNLLMVGTGAIGCELLKNYALLGVGVGKADVEKGLKAGRIVVTDPDIIEVSNLSRQFLFREKHLKKPKSMVAAAAAIYMNKELKENIIARIDKVCERTNHIYTDGFFEELTVVTNALDNVQARKYIDKRCVVARKPLLDSGTIGPKGHVQVILPNLTESYASTNDSEDTTQTPMCTLKMFPQDTLQCVEWARDKFENLFCQVPKHLVQLLEVGPSYLNNLTSSIKTQKKVFKALKHKPENFAHCIEYARLKFEKLFNHDIKQLLHVYPLDTRLKDGTLFWSLPKRPPVPVDFDSTNLLHCHFIAATACLRADMFKVLIPSSTLRSEQFRQYAGAQASEVQVPPFKANTEKAKEIQKSLTEFDSGEQDNVSDETSDAEEQKFDTSSASYYATHIQEMLTQIKGASNQSVYKIIKTNEFEKDNDANYHIDFIYSLANCRALNYKLDPMDWLTVKLKAGKIVPALATTTSVVSGLQALELVKLVIGCKKTDHRNIFLNLAVPLMQASEPGELVKHKLTQNIETTLWDRWDLPINRAETTLNEAIEKLEGIYVGLQVRDIIRENTPIYFYSIMNAPGKELAKEKLLNEKMAALVGAESDDKYVDLMVTFVQKGDPLEKMLTGVPSVRIIFE